MKIYIDHLIHNDTIAQVLSAKIRKRIPDVEVVTFLEQRTLIETIETANKKALILINESDIIIPLISPTFLENNDVRIEQAFNEIIDSKNKYLFPVICLPATWSNVNWIVKSKVFPFDGRSIMDLSEVEREIVFDILLHDIETIAHNEKLSPGDKGRFPFTSQEKAIFISHDHDDGDFAELLKINLEKQKILSWLDSDKLKIGQDWREEIDLGISTSLAVIAIMSPKAKKSEYVTYEWAFAWGKGKTIFPIMLKQTALHPRLESLQYLNFTNKATRPWSQLFSSINTLE
jgi:hypothetical protein